MSRVDFLTPFLVAARGSVPLAGPVRGNGLEHLLEMLDAAGGAPVRVDRLVAETGLTESSVLAIIEALDRIDAVSVIKATDGRAVAVEMPDVADPSPS